MRYGWSRSRAPWVLPHCSGAAKPRRFWVKNGGYLGLCPCLPTGQLDTDERTRDDAGAIQNLVVCHGGMAVHGAGPYPASLAHVG